MGKSIIRKKLYASDIKLKYVYDRIWYIVSPTFSQSRILKYFKNMRYIICMRIKMIYVMLGMYDIQWKKTIYRDMTYLLNIQDEYYLTYIIPKHI